MIRDLGVALAMQGRRRGGADGAERAGGQGRSADERQGPAHRRLELGHPSRRGAAWHQHADDRRHGDGVHARRQRPRGALVHRRWRLVARRVARGDQLCAPRAAAGRVLRREQPDRAVDAGTRADRLFARSRTRPSATEFPASPWTAPIPTRSPRRSRGLPTGHARDAGRR